jgi:hypothetical protein
VQYSQRVSCRGMIIVRGGEYRARLSHRAGEIIFVHFERHSFVRAGYPARARVTVRVWGLFFVHFDRHGAEFPSLLRSVSLARRCGQWVTPQILRT